MKSKFSYLVVLYLFCGAAIGHGQINTEAMRQTVPDSGFSGEVGFGLALKSGNTDLLETKAQMRSDYQKDRYHVFVVGLYQQGQEQKERFENKGFVHLRLVRVLRPGLKAEMFMQGEFNEFILLRDRALAGCGLRLRLTKSASGKQKSALASHLGSGFMWEQERYKNNSAKDARVVRSTNYWTLNWKIDKRTLVFWTTYYQVALDDIGNYRLLADGGVQFNLLGNLDIRIDLNYRYDNQPPSGVEFFDLELTNGITIRF